jgi:hypothetical protein
MKLEIEYMFMNFVIFKVFSTASVDKSESLVC